MLGVTINELVEEHYKQQEEETREKKLHIKKIKNYCIVVIAVCLTLSITLAVIFNRIWYCILLLWIPLLLCIKEIRHQISNINTYRHKIHNT